MRKFFKQLFDSNDWTNHTTEGDVFMPDKISDFTIIMIGLVGGFIIGMLITTFLNAVIIGVVFAFINFCKCFYEFKKSI